MKVDRFRSQRFEALVFLLLQICCECRKAVLSLNVHLLSKARMMSPLLSNTKSTLPSNSPCPEIVLGFQDTLSPFFSPSPPLSVTVLCKQIYCGSLSLVINETITPHCVFYLTLDYRFNSIIFQISTCPQDPTQESLFVNSDL